MLRGIRVSTGAILLGLLGCGRSPSVPPEQPATPPSPDRPAETRTARLGGLIDEGRIPEAIAVSARRDTLPTPKRETTAVIAGPVDSVALLVRNAHIPGRTFRDSLSLASAIRKGLRHPGWPVAGPDPMTDALLPARRIVAFYGNPLSTRMGILGELAPDQMLARLDTIAAEWERADPGTPVQRALHLITVVAQEQPGRDGMYRIRMDSAVVGRVYRWARSKDAILFLDVQAGFSTIEQELPRLLPWLARPDVHLAIDPEFYMHYRSAGHRPGKRVGTVTSAEVNHAIETLARVVDQYHLPPKVLVVHRFTRDMLQGARQIRLDPRVQVVINMDGWGEPWLKYDSYALCQVAEPVQFTGFKLFFRNDTRKGEPLLTPREVLALRPRPVYIQYQ